MSQDNSNTNTNTGLNNESFSTPIQTLNQGMGAVGDCAADIEIYMGDQSEKMEAAPGSPEGTKNIMGGGRKGDESPKKEGGVNSPK